MRIGALLVALGGIMVLSAQIERRTIFIHGTTVPGLWLLNQPDKQQKEPLGDKFVSLVEKSRNDERFYDSSIMLECGMVPIGHPLINQCRTCKLDAYQSRKAAVQAVTAYDDLTNHLENNLYYLYGWSGLLSDECRKKEAEKLYQEIIKLDKKTFEKTGVHPFFDIISHSHGGNIVLYLAQQEEIHKQGLSIDHALLYEPPVQVETAHYCTSPLFKNLVLLYSEGDFIQTADFISTTGKSCRTFSELISLDDAPNHIYEILLKLNGNAQALKHNTYFYFDAYHGLTGLHSTIFNKNDAIDFLNPLPLVIFSPVIIKMLEPVPARKNAALVLPGIRNELDICVADNSCVFNLNMVNQRQRFSQNLFPAITKIKERIATTWAPHAKTSNVKKLFWLGEHLITR